MTTSNKAYIITGPTSGIGRRTALEMAKHGTLVLVGRDRGRLDEVKALIEGKGGHAISVVCNLSDITSARNAAAEIVALKLPIAGVFNNAGIREERPTKSPQGWDNSFATNHLGPFAFTEALLPHLPDGAQVLFTCSAVEDPERKPAVMAGFRGARYISAEASARGEWEPGGSVKAGFDSYATSKQGNLATVLAFARETPRLRINAFEPGFSPGTGLGREAALPLRILAKLMTPLALLIPGGSTPGRAGCEATKILTRDSGPSGVYYGEKGQEMQGSAQVRDPQFQDRVVAETRALLATVQ